MMRPTSLIAGTLFGGVLLLAGYTSTARASETPVTRADSTALAVLPFTIDRSDTLLAPLAFGMPDLLTTDLSRSRRLVLVERAQMATILRELDLVKSGGVTQAGAPRVGRLMQARRVVTGSLRRINPSTVMFEAQINDVETGRVMQAVSATAPLNDLLIAEKQVALRIFTTLGIQLTPQERALVDQTPTKNLAALLAYSQGVQAEVNGQYALAMRRFRAAAKLDPGFSRAADRQHETEANLPNFATSAALTIVNRPLESIPATLTRGVATDPSFPAAAAAAKATIIVNISRP
jgi:TolB-like protein